MLFVLNFRDSRFESRDFFSLFTFPFPLSRAFLLTLPLFEVMMSENPMKESGVEVKHAKDNMEMSPSSCVMHLRLWLEAEGGLVFGPGRAELLECIEQLGSLRKAAEELGMSYRAAWGKIKRTEEVLGFRLVEKAGSYKEGYRLTEAGREFKEKFGRWRQEVEEDALQKARDIFLCKGIAIASEEQDGQAPDPR